MIQTIFFLLLVISFALLYLGRFRGSEVYTFIGAAFILMLGMVMMNGNLEIVKGKTAVTTGNTTVTTTDYAAYSSTAAFSSNHVFGFWILLSGIIIFIDGMFTMRGGKPE